MCAIKTLFLLRKKSFLEKSPRRVWLHPEVNGWFGDK
jgi:hypothetical protein